MLGACAALGPPDIETRRIYAGVDPDELYARALQALQASELEVTGSDRASSEVTAVGRFDARD